MGVHKGPMMVKGTRINRIEGAGKEHQGTRKERSDALKCTTGRARGVIASRQRRGLPTFTDRAVLAVRGRQTQKGGQALVFIKDCSIPTENAIIRIAESGPSGRLGFGLGSRRLGYESPIQFVVGRELLRLPRSSSDNERQSSHLNLVFFESLRSGSHAATLGGMGNWLLYG